MKILKAFSLLQLKCAAIAEVLRKRQRIEDTCDSVSAKQVVTKLALLNTYFRRKVVHHHVLLSNVFGFLLVD